MRRPLSTRVPSLGVILFSLLSSFLLVSSQNSTKKICETKECLSAAQNLKESMDHGADPCEDFYQYACGNWPNVHKNPNDSEITLSTIQLRKGENTAELADFLRQNNTKNEPEAVHKARKFFWLCLNEAAYSNKLEKIVPQLQEIGLSLVPFITEEITNKTFDYTTALAKAAKVTGVNIFFDLTIDLHPFNLTLNKIVLSNIKEASDSTSTTTPLASKEKISEAQFMIEVMQRMCEVSSSPSDCTRWISPENGARNTTIKKILTQQDDIRQINSAPSKPVLLTLKELQNLTDSIALEVNTTLPKWNWTRYLEETFAGLNFVKLNLSDPAKIKISSSDSIEKIIRYIYEKNNLKLIELGIWWKVVSELLPYIDLSICDIKNKLNSLEVSPTRENSCIQKTRLAFSLAVSYSYTTKQKYIKAKTDISRMFQHIRESLHQIIKETTWMDEKTRQRALRKVELMKSYLVYPSALKDTNLLNDLYKDIKISNNFYDSIISINQNEQKKYYPSIQNKTNDLNEISTDPSEVNAFYEFRTNTMIIPAGILGLSYYNNSLRALDYGGIGSVIGHEITHGFDNKGRRYNETGDAEDWWQNDTVSSYKEKGQCFVHAYGNYSSNFGNITQTTDSVNSLGENIADNGGFKESLLAYRRGVAEYGEEPILPHFENFTHEQLLTLALANLHCENPTKLSAEKSRINVHSPKPLRVNVVFQNSKEFADIWKCPKGSKMNPNKEKCSIW
ncbi:neprilysin-11-like [Planococcus citri]|uniref:neprilysin-11-like n=1 Tax=Planococcus citri TaxID=170843 RepID=UPI0031F74F33